MQVVSDHLKQQSNYLGDRIAKATEDTSKADGDLYRSKLAVSAREQALPRKLMWRSVWVSALTVVLTFVAFLYAVGISLGCKAFQGEWFLYLDVCRLPSLMDPNL